MSGSPALTMSASPTPAGPRTTVMDHSRRHSVSSTGNKSHDDPINNAFPGLQRSSSCISVVTSRSSPHISVVTSRSSAHVRVSTSEVPQNRQNLAPIPERSESPKRYFSFRTNPFKQSPYLSLGVNRLDHSKNNFIDIFKSKLSLNPKLNYGQDKTFEKICFELARADNLEVGSEACQIFEAVDLTLNIKTIGKSYNLTLPPAMNVAGLGDEEEQGKGGTCDQFIGVLPPSCRKVSLVLTLGQPNCGEPQ
ncbi:hypothetical protein K440DRAFT_638278 [Wilcoxina mikolae CBS 423.85]|nr:hypothetical protein K440DRAFT_638278 [Wilcoxina mikolae CBS 423.85]